MKNVRTMLAATAAAATTMLMTATPAHATYTQTKNPIVLVHGLLGWDNIAGVDYFYKIPAALRADGAKVYTVTLSGSESHEVRGEQLLAQVKQIMAISGATKVNLVAHSQGSPAARYVAGVRPDIVSSVTSVGGVNRGSKVADLIAKKIPADSFTFTLVSGAVNTIGGLITSLSGSSGLPQNSAASLASLSTEGSAAFNAKFPQAIPTTACGEGAYNVNGIRYYSWTGAKTSTNWLDIGDSALNIASSVFGSEPSDGLVGVCSTHLGKVIGNKYRMTHMDEVNQFFGLVDLWETSPVTLYRQHANRLKTAGL